MVCQVADHPNPLERTCSRTPSTSSRSNRYWRITSANGWDASTATSSPPRNRRSPIWSATTTPGAGQGYRERASLPKELRFVQVGQDQELRAQPKYLAVVLPRTDNTDELRVVDIGRREQQSVDIPSDVRVDSLKFSPVDNRFVFVAQSVATPDTSETGKSYIKAYGTNSTTTTSTASSCNPWTL